MLTVTEAALQHLHHALNRTEAIDPACFRLTLTDEDALGLVVEAPESSDQTFECAGDTVLATPQPLGEVLSERVLDLDDQGHLVLMPKDA